VKRPHRIVLYLGVALVVVGWVALFLGWYQAGRQDLQTGQIPYVMSGGFGGWALLAMGALLIFLDVVRQIERRAHAHLRDLQRTLERIAESLGEPARPAAKAEDGARPPRKGAPRRSRATGTP
jgi:hypothetical protein